MKTRKCVAVETGLLLFVLLFPGCKKEYSYEGGTAVFSLLNVGGSCTDPVVSGSYFIGSTLGPSNTVQLQVEVTNPGRFNFQTDSRSGFHYSVTGSFPDTGVQTVTLTASGRPDSIGHFLFTPEVLSSCAFSVEVTEQQAVADYTLVESGGGLCVGTLTGAYTAGVPLDASDTYTLSVYVTALGNFTISTPTVSGVSFYYTGTYTSLGTQTVTLTGYGTPTTVGIITLTPEIVGPAPIGGQACDFNVGVK